MTSNVGEPTGSLVGRSAFRTVCLVIAAFTLPLSVFNLISAEYLLGLVGAVFGLAT